MHKHVVCNVKKTYLFKFWNYICIALNKLLNSIMARKVKIKVSDSGLRGKFNGELYVDKKVFFKRADVRAVIKSLKESIALKEHIEENKKELSKVH